MFNLGVFGVIVVDEVDEMEGVSDIIWGVVNCCMVVIEVEVLLVMVMMVNVDMVFFVMGGFGGGDLGGGVGFGLVFGSGVFGGLGFVLFVELIVCMKFVDMVLWVGVLEIDGIGLVEV